MESLRIGITRSRLTSSGDTFDVLSDYGTGVIDEVAPVNVQPLPFYAPEGAAAVHVDLSHLQTRHLDLAFGDGHLDGSHVLFEHLLPTGIIDFVTPPVYFGAIQFAVRTYRGAHRAATVGKAITIVANSVPRPVYRVDSVAVSDGVVSLFFEASPDLA